MLGSAPRNKSERPFLYVNLGNIISIVSIIVTIMIFHGKVMSRISVIETKLDFMYTWFDKQILEKPFRNEPANLPTFNADPFKNFRAKPKPLIKIEPILANPGKGPLEYKNGHDKRDGN